MVLSTHHQLREWLGAVDFPADKAAIARSAERHGAPDEVRAALRSLPPQLEFANRDDVMASVRVDEGQSGSEKANERRHHTHPGLAEQNTEIPTNPITEELGENRRS